MGPPPRSPDSQGPGFCLRGWGSHFSSERRESLIILRPRLWASPKFRNTRKIFFCCYGWHFRGIRKERDGQSALMSGIGRCVGLSSGWSSMSQRPSDSCRQKDRHAPCQPRCQWSRISRVLTHHLQNLSAAKYWLKMLMAFAHIQVCKYLCNVLKDLLVPLGCAAVKNACAWEIPAVRKMPGPRHSRDMLPVGRTHGLVATEREPGFCRSWAGGKAPQRDGGSS